jgi:type I restriction enzyme M protein
VEVLLKRYPQADDCFIEINLEKQTINYGDKIQSDNKTTQNFSQPENFVVLECVNRLLEKGYKPENITLEKTWGAGHGTSGRLDICVTRDDGSEYLLIECKNYGKDFDKEFARMKKDGGQLFTYFKFSNKADVIMLYASELKGKEIIYRNEIVKIEDDYRTGDVKDFYEKWNKLTKDNGIFEEWLKPYNFESKALTINNLKEIKQEDSSFIFNQFLEILRHNVVSDKGNAFNRIFSMFLCKIYDEKINEETGNELGFQWLEGIDDHRRFQLRLTDLYQNGMHEFLEKVVTDFSETEFKNKFPELSEKQREPIIEIFRKLRLEKHNEFAIKDVYDEQSFNENATVVKEVVQLLEKYKLRYAKKQQYLSDFFELLLTTGLKQESGQFFTPVPVAQFIIKSLPVGKIMDEKLSAAKLDNDTLLPYIMDYAAGSGHFVTEMMHEIQRLLQTKNDKDYLPSIAKQIRFWKDDNFSWAINYIYGIEKDYRLVKVGKVGCYLHGDGLANVIHSDGLARLGHPDYKGKLLLKDKDFPQDNKQFDILVSNPPYSVSAFKNNASKFYGKEDFELYDYLTDNSSEIECLFIERTKQLLKDGGVAGIILPSSILSNEGIYTKARELILKYFEIIAITELGSNTFMATGTNTVVLFLRRKNNYDCVNLQKSIERFFDDWQDVTRNGIEKPIVKYVNHAWKTISFDDYITLLKKEPNEAINNHEIYKEYRKKIKAKTEKDFWNTLIETEKEKLLYFILTYPQKVVLVKTGEKDAEKRFLGYEFSNRRGSEGIHPIQRGKTIDQCTKLFDEDRFDNQEKASTYIYKAFSSDYDFPIHESLKDNVSRVNLVEMITFDRATFAKNISTAIKKKVKIESKNKQIPLGEVVKIKNGFAFKSSEYVEDGLKIIRIKNVQKGFIQDDSPIFIDKNREKEFEQFILKKGDILISMTGNPGRVGILKTNHLPALLNQRVGKIEIINNQVLKEFIFHILNTEYFENSVVDLSQGIAQLNVSSSQIESIKIPLPPKEIQEKIVSEIEILEKKAAEAKGKIGETESKKSQTIDNYFNQNQNIKKLGDVVGFKRGPFGGSLKKEIFVENGYKIYEQQHAIKNDFSIGRYYITEEKFKEMKGFELIEDDLIMSCSGTIGKIAVFPKNAEKGIINQALLRFRPIENLTITPYLRICLSHITSKFEDNSHGTGLKNVASVEILKDINIYCPPLSEQQKIVSEIEKIETQITELEQQLQKIPQEKEAVLKKYL